jgi:hypothetical protein
MMHLDFAGDMISAETLPIDLEIFSLREWGFMVYRFYSTDSAAKVSRKGRKGAQRAQRKTHSLYQIGRQFFFFCALCFLLCVFA